MKIRPIQPQDFLEVEKIETEVWGTEGANIDQIKSRYRVFSHGSIVAERDDGKLVAYAAAQRVNKLTTGSWVDQTDHGNIEKTHVGDGQIAYGVNMSVLQEAAALKISRSIIEHYHRIFILEGDCSILALGSRLPGFARWQAKTDGTIRDYIHLKKNGFSIDPELRLYQQNGFSVLWEVNGYFSDKKSRNCGVIITARNFCSV